jgi:hypothetical protein
MRRANQDMNMKHLNKWANSHSIPAIASPKPIMLIA